MSLNQKKFRSFYFLKTLMLLSLVFYIQSPSLYAQENQSKNLLEIEPVMQDDEDDDTTDTVSDEADEQTAEADSSDENTELADDFELKGNEPEDLSEEGEDVAIQGDESGDLEIVKESEPLGPIEPVDEDDDNQEFISEENSQEEDLAPSVLVDAREDLSSDKEDDQEPMDDSLQETLSTETLTRKQVVEELRPNNRKKHKRIAHPDAKRGLLRITKDNVYIYSTKKIPTNQAVSFNIGSYSPNGLVTKEGTDFSSIYDTGFMIQGDKEYPIWRGSFGILSWKWGTGLMVTQGNGILQSSGRASLEKFTFMMMPNHVGAVYKAQFSDSQLFVPYVEGGIGYYTFLERRDDNVGSGIHKIFGKLGGSPVAHYGGGISLNLMKTSRTARLTLNREYGISGFWLRGDVRILAGLDQSFDLSANVINIGLTAEY